MEWPLSLWLIFFVEFCYKGCFEIDYRKMSIYHGILLKNLGQRELSRCHIHLEFINLHVSLTFSDICFEFIFLFYFYRLFESLIWFFRFYFSNYLWFQEEKFDSQLFTFLFYRYSFRYLQSSSWYYRLVSLSYLILFSISSVHPV